eukprot:scaffold17604_cov65-Cyclotella_meneghiniana.AAC.3
MSYESTNTPFSLSIRSTRGHIRDRYEDTRMMRHTRTSHGNGHDTITRMATMNDHGNDERRTIMAAITITTRISCKTTRLQSPRS